MNILTLFLLSGALTAALIPLSLPWLRRLKFGQFVREDGPQSHLVKSGTPTMGGLIFITVITVLTLIFTPSPSIIAILLVCIGFAVVGFIDDYIKVAKTRSMGFKAWQKVLAQLVITGLYIVFIMKNQPNPTEIILPFTKGYMLDLGWFFIPFMLFFIVGTVNAVNLTDGIDGLSTSVTIAVLTFFLITDITFAMNLSPFLAITIGALFGFLIYNCHPAALFMGDTGSLALGGIVAAVSVHTRLPLIIIIVGLIYLCEVLSVIIQVGWYKRTGKRVFKMAPIHHHFELMGWKETKVVYVFTIVTIFLCTIAYMSLTMI